MTVYGLAVELAVHLPGCLVVSVERHHAGCTITLEGDGPPVLEVLYNTREAEVLLPEASPAGPDHRVPDLEQAAGKRISSVRPLGLDRIILVGLEGSDPWGNDDDCVLRLDLSPGMKAVSLFSAPGGALKGSCGASKTRAPSRPEELPPARRWSLLDMPGECPDAFRGLMGRDALRACGGGEMPGAATALVSTVGGVDPSLASIVLSRAEGLDADTSTVVWETLAETGRRLARREFDWGIYDFPEVARGGFCNLYPVGLPFSRRPERPAGFKEALAERAEEVVLPGLIEDLRRTVRKTAHRELRRAERLIGKLDGELGSAQRFREMRHLGNLLAGSRHLMRRGMASITVTDYSSGAPLEIPLDPALTPDDNIKAYFKRARKGEKGLLVIRERRARAKEKLEAIREDLREIDRTASVDGLLDKLPPARRGKGGRGRAPVRSRSRFRTFQLDGVHTICVGRSDEENDMLTHRYASPSDLWFHAQGLPGSHVILRGAGRNTPRSYIEKAAEVAAWFSKGRSSATVPVIFTEKRYVRKPRGSRPGTAACVREKTLFVTPRLPDGSGEPSGQ